jgi:hypothetical protein
VRSKLPPELFNSAVKLVLAKTGGLMLRTVHVLVRNSNIVMVNSTNVAVSSNNVANNPGVQPMERTSLGQCRRRRITSHDCFSVQSQLFSRGSHVASTRPSGAPGRSCE